jgi:hypothetical protein
MDCRDLQAVQDEARASAQDMAKAALRSYSVHAPASMEIEDEQGKAVQERTPALWIH